MSGQRYRVTLHPLEPTCGAPCLMLTEGEVCDLTSAMQYGCGWFQLRDRGTTSWFNLKAFARVTIEQMGGGWG